MVALFNDRHLRFVICTSSLIEGVNTSAKNVVIYESKIGVPRLDTERCDILDLAGENLHASAHVIAAGILGRERGKRRIDLDQGDAQIRHAPCQRQPCPADAGAEVDRVFAGPAAGRRRQQNGVMADAVAAFGLQQPQPAAEHGVVGGFDPGAHGAQDVCGRSS